MATNPLLKLFGWESSKAPKSKLRKGDVDPLYGSASPYENYGNFTQVPYSRRRRYDIYDDLDEIEIISSILNAYAEDATQSDREHRSIIWIEAKDSKVKKIWEELSERLKLEDNIIAITRDVAKFGDDFAQLDIEKGYIEGWDWKDPREIERIENNQGTLVGFELTKVLLGISGVSASMNPDINPLSYELDKKVDLTYKPWEILHFRLFRRKRLRRQKFRNIYGTAILAGSEKIGKQVKILDDMLMVRRLTKTLDKYIYKVDTGRASPEEEIMILKRWRNALKRRPYIDPVNKRFDQWFDPFTFTEDLFWPVRTDSQSAVEVIPGQPNVADIVDVEHFMNKLFGSLRAPKGYFGFEGDLNAKATLSSQDMQFGRAVNSLQHAVKNGLSRLLQIELALRGEDPYSEFKIMMVVPSVLEDLSRLEATQTLIDVAERMASLGETLQLDPVEWKKHILQSVLGMSDEELDRFSEPPESEDPTEPSEGDPPAEPILNNPKAIDEAIKQLIIQRSKRTSLSIERVEPARRDELPGGTISMEDLLPVSVEDPENTNKIELDD